MDLIRLFLPMESLAAARPIRRLPTIKNDWGKSSGGSLCSFPHRPLGKGPATQSYPSRRPPAFLHRNLQLSYQGYTGVRG